MQKLVWQNANGVELDLTSGNYGITEWEGFSNTGLNIQTQTVPFQDGGVFLDALIEQRELTVTLAIQDNNNLELRYQQRRELISALNPKLGEGYLIYTNDFISKRIKCIPQIPIFETHNSDTAGTPKASLSWVACEPYWEDLEETSVTFKDVQVLENNGDVPVQIKATIPFVSKNPVLMNSRNNKMIGLEGSQQGTVVINTNNGQKSVVGESLGFKWENGGAFQNSLYKYGKSYYFGEGVTLEENEMTGTIKAVDYNLQNIGIVDYAEGNGIFVGVGNGKIYSSVDGVNWIVRKNTVNDQWVCFVNDRFYVGIEYSFDGIEWLEIAEGNYGPDKATAYGNGIYLAVGYNTSGTSVEPYSSKSIDGVNWEYVGVSGRVTFKGLAFGNGVFVAILTGTDANIIISTDGSSWTNQGNFGYLSDIKFINGLFIAAGSEGNIWTSTDGTTWTQRASGVTGNLRKISNNNGKIIICGDECILESENGTEWEIKYGGTDFKEIIKLAHNEDIIVGVGAYSIITSSDGVEWTKRKSFDFQTENYEKVIYADNKFSAVGGYTTPYIATSPDGIEWTVQTSGINEGDLKSITYGNGLFVAVGSGDSSNPALILTSPDGITWTRRTCGSVFSFNDVIYADGKYVAVGDSMNIWTSTDGITWTYRMGETSQGVWAGSFLTVTYGNHRFVAIWNNLRNVVYISTDGEGWQQVYQTTSVTPIRCVYYANNIFIMTGGWNEIYISADGINWEQIDLYMWTTIYGIDYFNNKFILCGNNGIIFNSVLIGEIINLISNLIPDSDMTFNLETGQNSLMFSDNNGKEVTITYRQKYIGV